MKLSVNGYVKTVVEGDVSSTLIVEIPRYMSKHFYDIPEEKKLNFYITEVKKRRTLAQNDTAWGIMRDIARNMDLVPDVEDVYRQILTHANIKSNFVMTVPEAKKELEKVFRVVIDHGERDIEAKNGTKLHTL